MGGFEGTGMYRKISGRETGRESGRGERFGGGFQERRDMGAVKDDEKIKLSLLSQIYDNGNRKLGKNQNEG